MSSKKRKMTLAQANTATDRRSALRDVLDLLDKDARQRLPEVPTVRWLALAQELNISLHTVMHWARLGAIPRDKATIIGFKYAHLKEGLPPQEELSRIVND